MPKKKETEKNEKVYLDKKIDKKIKKQKSNSLGPKENLQQLKKYSKKSYKKYIVLGFLLFLLYLIYLNKGFFIAAIVAGKPITRWQVIKELEKQGGQQVLENLITKDLVLREASRKNISVSNEEVAAEIEKIKKSLESQGTTLDAGLSLQGQTQKTLEENIRLQKTLEQLLKDDIRVSDEDILKYYQENKDYYDSNLRYEDLKETIRQQLTRDKLQKAFNDWIEKLKSETELIYFVDYSN